MRFRCAGRRFLISLTLMEWKEIISSTIRSMDEKGRSVFAAARGLRELLWRGGGGAFVPGSDAGPGAETGAACGPSTRGRDTAGEGGRKKKRTQEWCEQADGRDVLCPTQQ